MNYDASQIFHTLLHYKYMLLFYKKPSSRPSSKSSLFFDFFYQILVLKIPQFLNFHCTYSAIQAEHKEDQNSEFHF